MKHLAAIAFLIASLVCLNGASAQATTQPEGDGRDKPILTTQGELDDLRNAIKSLQAQLDQLKSEVQQLRQQVAAAPGAGTKEAAQPAAPADQHSPLIFEHVKITKGEFGNDELIGDIKNNTGRDYRILMLKVKFYNNAGDLLGISQVALENFPNGTEKGFEALIANMDPSVIATYKVDIDSGY